MRMTSVGAAPLFSILISIAGCATTNSAAPKKNAAEILFNEDPLIFIAPHLYAERAIPEAVRARLVRDRAAAAEQLTVELGRLEADPPDVIFCQSEACRVYFAGASQRSCVLAPGEHPEGGRFTAKRTTIFIGRVDAVARGVLTHELAHIEMQKRLNEKFAPAWFNEGLAASFGDEPKCVPGLRGIDDLRRLDGNGAWFGYTNMPGTIRDTYCQARFEFESWLKREGKPRLFELIAAVREGKPFKEQYGEMATRDVKERSNVLMSGFVELGDGARPFTIAFWMKPNAAGGVLAHVSANEVGTGWCTPFVGYDRDGRVVAQVLSRDGDGRGGAENYAVATVPRDRAPKVGEWSHVAMTWSPAGGDRVYVNGVEVARAEAPRYHAGGGLRFVTWGSSNVGGMTCWQGAVVPAIFNGSLTGMNVFETELNATDIAKLAAESKP